MACKYLHCANTVTVNADTSVVLNFSVPANAEDKDRFCIKIVTDIPSSSLPVLLTINGVSTNTFLNKYGNPVIASDLKKGKCYHGYYGSSTPHVITTDIPLKCGCL